MLLCSDRSLGPPLNLGPRQLLNMPMLKAGPDCYYQIDCHNDWHQYETSKHLKNNVSLGLIEYWDWQNNDNYKATELMQHSWVTRLADHDSLASIMFIYWVWGMSVYNRFYSNVWVWYYIRRVCTVAVKDLMST